MQTAAAEQPGTQTPMLLTFPMLWWKGVIFPYNQASLPNLQKHTGVVELSVIDGTHSGRERTESCKLPSDLYTHTIDHVHV